MDPKVHARAPCGRVGGHLESPTAHTRAPHIPKEVEQKYPKYPHNSSLDETKNTHWTSAVEKRASGSIPGDENINALPTGKSANGVVYGRSPVN